MAQCDDPLRFLNIRRKKEQNKKHTPLKKTHEADTSQFMLPSFTSLPSMQQCHKTTYNPLRYFCEEVEEFLNGLNPKPKEEEQKQMTFAKDRQRMAKFGLQANSLEMMTFSRQNKRRKLFEEFQNDEEQSYGPTRQNYLKKANEVGEFKKTNKNNRAEQKGNPGDGMQINIGEFELAKDGVDSSENCPEVQTLKECEVCHRRFNPTSYEKHIRVCERVFMQKRKPFRSRSTSLDANAARKR